MYLSRLRAELDILGYRSMDESGPYLLYSSGKNSLAIDSRQGRLKYIHGGAESDWVSYLCLDSVYRGQYGSSKSLETRLQSFTFSDKESAVSYALEPNNKYDLVHSPKVFEASITINKPFIINLDDPFVDASDIIKAVGRDVARTMLLNLEGHIKNTNNWYEISDETGCDSLEELFRHDDRYLDRLYVDIYPLLDDPFCIEVLKQHRFDGAIHAGNGVTAESPEYRVFNQDQVNVKAVFSLDDISAARSIIDKSSAALRTAIASAGMTFNQDRPTLELTGSTPAI